MHFNPYSSAPTCLNARSLEHPTLENWDTRYRREGLNTKSPLQALTLQGNPSLKRRLPTLPLAQYHRRERA